MKAEFLSKNIWPEITKGVRAAQQPCHAAVAYFGAGSSLRLPLPRGSKLVVNASERAVASGQTCPADLQLLVGRGISVYSVDNLHAKVFVIGDTAFVGSNNVSRTSAEHWIEAALRVDQPSLVKKARDFVLSNCLRELSPKMLANLAVQYRPPINFSGLARNARGGTSSLATIPRVMLAQLHMGQWSEEDEQLKLKGLRTAKRRQQHLSWEIEDFSVNGRCRYVPNDQVIQIMDMGTGKFLVSSPANVLAIQQERRSRNSLVSIVLLERKSYRRRNLAALANTLKCAPEKLRRDGVVRDTSLAAKLLNIWPLMD